MKQEFGVQSRWWGFSNGSESQSRPVEAERILPHGLSKGRLFRIIQSWIDPFISAEADGFRKREVKAGIPVDDDEDVHNQVSNTEDVGVVGLSLGPGEELHHSADSQKLVDSNLWVVEAKVEVKDVSGNNGHHIKTELEAAGVSVPEALLIFHQQALFQVTCVQKRPNGVKQTPLTATIALDCTSVTIVHTQKRQGYLFWS